MRLCKDCKCNRLDRTKCGKDARYFEPKKSLTLKSTLCNIKDFIRSLFKEITG